MSRFPYTIRDADDRPVVIKTSEQAVAYEIGEGEVQDLYDDETFYGLGDDNFAEHAIVPEYMREIPLEGIAVQPAMAADGETK